MTGRAVVGDRAPGLWRCPEYGQRFTARRQWHSCGAFRLDALFARSDPVVQSLYERFVEAARACGLVTVTAQKTRIVLQARMRFAALVPRKRTLAGHLVLAHRHASDRFTRIDTVSLRRHVHAFRLASRREIDAELRGLIAEAFALGRQARPGPPAR